MLTVLAVMVPPVSVILPDELSVTVPMVPAPASKLPFTFSVPALTLSEKVEPLPADEAPRVTAPV